MTLASVTCPAPECDDGTGKPFTFKAATIKTAIRFRDEHIRSAHSGYRPPRGSIQDRAPRLD